MKQAMIALALAGVCCAGGLAASPAPAAALDCKKFFASIGMMVAVPCEEQVTSGAPAASMPKASPKPGASTPTPNPSKVLPAAFVPARPKPVVVSAPVATATALNKVASRATTAPAPKRKTALCGDILERAHLGDISAEDRSTLQRDC